MSLITNPVSTQPATEATQINAQAPQIPAFLQTANRVTKLIFAVIFTIVAIGCIGIGVTMMPFAPEPAMAAAGFGTTLLGFAGYLFYSSFSADLSSRAVTVHS